MEASVLPIRMEFCWERYTLGSADAVNQVLPDATLLHHHRRASLECPLPILYPDFFWEVQLLLG